MFIKKGKTNWFYVIVVALIAGAVGGISVSYINGLMAQEEMDYADAIRYRQAPDSKSDNGEYTGTYSYNFGESSFNNKPSGKLLVLQVSAKEIDFALSLSGAGPAFPTGRLYSARAALNGKSATYENSEYGNCEFEILFGDDKAIIKTIKDGGECGFGHSIFADGVYEKADGSVPEFPKEGDPAF